MYQDQTLAPEKTRRTGPLRSALNVLTHRLRRDTRPMSASALQSISTEELRKRLSMTVINGHPDRKALAEFLKPAYLDWQAQDWYALGQRLNRLDRRHAALPSGDRVVPALGRALFRRIAGTQVCQLIDRGQAVTTSELPESLFTPLIRAISRPDTDPAIHFLTAQFNLETGWARRGDDQTDFALEDAMNAAQARFRVARNILDRVAVRAPHSAYFAELDYRVRAAEGCTEEELTRAALRWSRTDPTALTPYAVHGLHLLPRWYGTGQSLSGFADRVWAKTHETLGAAGYAACYLSAMEADPSVLLTLDLDAFREGLVDMMQASDDPDITCNAILRSLWEVSLEGAGTGGGRDSTALRRARRELRAMFVYIAHHALGPVMPDAWGAGWTETRILHALAQAFADELIKGRHVAIGLDGAVIGAAA